MSEHLNHVGDDFIIEQMLGLIDNIPHIVPSKFNEENRYLPPSVSSTPGYIRYDVTPYLREIIDCFSVESQVREIAVMKGVQIGWTTLLESVLLYFMVHVRTSPCMFMTADKELALARIENNILPMLQQSDFGDIIRSSDEGNTRKTGNTRNHIQWEGGGYLVPFGSKNADKMRSFSILLLLLDEIDAFPTMIGKSGCPVKLASGRCKGYWARRKIGLGSTPLIKGTSKIEAAYKLGDQRKYIILCKSCGFPQHMRWEVINKETGIIGGFVWEMEGNQLILESVAWACSECGHKHYEVDKRKLFSKASGAHWKPTVRPSQPGFRSYHLPAMYSPMGMAPFYSLVADYVAAYDTKTKKVIDIGKYQVFYNEVLAETFEIKGSKVSFTAVSAHRRAVYRLGEIPNEHAKQYANSPILLLTCTVDIQKNDLAVVVIGWAAGSISYIIDYWRFEVKKGEPDCQEINSPVWGRLREVIEEKEYIDDGKKYKIAYTFVDAGYSNATANAFCDDYSANVYPILGRPRPTKNATIKEFSEFTTKSGSKGYLIVVDHYKDRLAPVLRREWIDGDQKPYHFNAPVDITDKQLKELTVETRKEKIDENGIVTNVWFRPQHADNELWDLLIYGHCAIEVLAWNLCINHFELETIEWPKFWEYIEKEELYFESLNSD